MIRATMYVKLKHYRSVWELCNALCVKFYPSTVHKDEIYMIFEFDTNQQSREFNKRYYSFVNLDIRENVSRLTFLNRIVNHFKYYFNSLSWC